MKFRQALLLAFWATFACIVSLYFFAPRFFLWNVWGDSPYSYFPESNRAPDLLTQLYDPFAPAQGGANKVIQWRLLPPIVANLLHLDWSLYFALPFIFSYVLVMFGAFWVALRAQSLWAGVATAGVIATSSAFFVSTGFLGYLDSLLGLCLLGAVVAEAPLTLGLLGLFSPWVDERFILALPIILWSRWALGKPLRPCLWMVLGVLPYLGARAWVLLTGCDFSGGYLKTVAAFNHKPVRLAEGLWDSLRWGWLLSVGALVMAGGKKLWWGLAVLLPTLLVQLIIAGDYSRSLAVALPLAVAGIILLWKSPQLRWLVIILVLVNFITPAYHSFRAFKFQILPMPIQFKISQSLKS